MDLLAEVRGAFASDAVWLTDLEPVHGYDSAKALGPKTAQRKEKNGMSVVKAEFGTSQFDKSALVDIKIQEPAPTGRRPAQQAQAAPPAVTANAVRIKGFWRENPKSQNVVSELLKNLRDKSTHFRFAAKDANGADVTLSDDQILDITVTGAPGELGLPFEITLPLAREVAIK
jgi:hypothetical protein